MNEAATVTKRDVEQTRAESALLPLVDVVEDAGGITLYADLPGVSKENLHLEIEAENLTIAGEVSLNTPDNLEASHIELELPRYRRVFALSKELDSAKVTAEFKNGVLQLRIPKAEHAQPRKIEIQVS